MLMTETQLRSIIRTTLIIENEEKQINKLESKLDAADAQLEKMMSKALPKMDKTARKDKKDKVLDDGNVGDEAIVAGAIGFGLSIPLFLKLCGYAAQALGNTLGWLESKLTSSDDLADIGDQWADWWMNWAKKAKEKKKGLMKSFAKKLLSIKYEDPSDLQIDFLSNALWALIYCWLGIEAGITAWNAFKEPDFWHTMYGGYEAILAAVKEGEAAIFLSEVIALAGELGAAA